MTRAAIATVRAKFRARLPAKAVELEDALGAVDETPQALAALAHKLAGAAGFYGFDDIAGLARDLERRLEAPDGANAADVRLDVERLVRLLHARAADMP